MEEENNLEKALWKDYNDNLIVLNSLRKDFGSSEYKTMSEEVDHIRNELLKLKQIDNDRIIKENEIKNENRKEKIRNIITIATFSCSTLISLITINKTFKFDEGATVTSTLGRGVLNSVVPKFFKH